ncbi:hypothetical protein H0H81_012383 [Sphagnurus paluster]|uniref:Protein kinase domain-containing protein n=1 Tax=Sphagnurus paluster TaxID=117069 RepID=A0A9P7FNF5_9AGAR|nr:hypothetical protein H0H81_012383 [Sphagnurus paluster]
MAKSLRRGKILPPQEVFSLGNQTQPRSDSKIKQTPDRTGPAKVEQRRRERGMASQNIGTPVKSSNTIYSGASITRDEVVGGLTSELLNRRWESFDLVNHAFGHIVDIALSARILLVFLHNGIIRVKNGEEALEKTLWPEACAKAAWLARYHSLAFKATAKKLAEFDCYKWEWNVGQLRTGTETGAENFFNGVGLSAYMAAMLFDHEVLSNRNPTTRFTTLPNQYRALPIPSSDKQDCRPDFLAFPRSVFFREADRDQSRLEDFLPKPSLLKFVEEFAPKLAAPYVAGVFDQEETSFLTPDEVLEPALFIDEDGPDITASSDEDDASEDIAYSDLLKILKEIHIGLEQDQLSPPEWAIDAIREYSDSRHLDMAHVCFPNINVPGETKEKRMLNSALQAIVYMRQQRRTQSWRRFGLGLMTTKDKVGLLRADPTGIEQCILPKNTAHGIIEIIRLTLGLLVANETEFGTHPCCTSFREVETPVPATHTPEPPETTAEESDLFSSVGKKRSGANLGDTAAAKKQRTSGKQHSKAKSEHVPYPTRYFHVELNTITLDHSKIHTGPHNAAQHTHYYVKYLLEDRGSLVGRCTRIWCVYEELTGVEKAELAEEHQLDDAQPIFLGPYALKIYTADIHTEAYTQEIFKKVSGKNIPCVLLPKRVWYVGKVLDVVRDLSEDDKINGVTLRDREEIFTVSDLKRTLDQFANPYEFYGAIIGVLKGIEALADIGIMHRDISPGNIVLDDELEVGSQGLVQDVEIALDDKNKAEKVILLRRNPVKLGDVGGLHDLDMASSIVSSKAGLGKFTFGVGKKAVETNKNSRRDHRTGTTPYISIPVLLGWEHTVYCDLQSLFFVQYLSPFTYNGPKPNRYPEAPIMDSYHWPEEIGSWADSPGRSLDDLGGAKSRFFETTHSWGLLADKCLGYWSTLNEATKEEVLDHPYVNMLSALRSILWKEQPEVGTWFPAMESATPRKVIETMEEALESNKHLLGWVAPSSSGDPADDPADSSD